MAIGRQGFVDASLLHQQKTDRVAKRISFIEMRLQEPRRLGMKGDVDPDNFHLGIAHHFRDVSQRCLAGQTSRLGQGNQLGQPSLCVSRAAAAS